MSDMALEEWLERTRVGELYVSHLTGSALRFCRRVTGPWPRIWSRTRSRGWWGGFHHLRFPDASDAYLRRAIVNLSRSHFRHRRVERAYLERLAGAPEPGSNPNEDLDEMVHEALLRLPERQRAALALRFFEDLSDVQTGEIMRCPAGTVRSLVSRGMKTLRAELEGVTR